MFVNVGNIVQYSEKVPTATSTFYEAPASAFTLNLHYAFIYVIINRCLNKGKGSIVNNLFILNLILFLQSFSVNNLLKL